MLGNLGTNISLHVLVIISYICIANIDKPYRKYIVSNSIVIKIKHALLSPSLS